MSLLHIFGYKQSDFGKRANVGEGIVHVHLRDGEPIGMIPPSVCKTVILIEKITFTTNDSDLALHGTGESRSKQRIDSAPSDAASTVVSFPSCLSACGE
jgi:hypothetical protein